MVTDALAEIWKFLSGLVQLEIPGTGMSWATLVIILFIFQIIRVSIKNASGGDDN